jgi:Glycosyl hydrolases family 17/X8 domain
MCDIYVGVWRDDITDLMDQIVEFYHNNSAPFTVNIYPFLSLYYGKGKFPVDYAFFDGNPNPLMDNGAAYTNVLDANYDTLASVLNKAGYKDMPIIVGEIGWPTDGDINANVTLAQKFYQGLVKHLAAKKGTPLRPKDQMNVYLFGFIDEEGKSILPGDFERHWGIFTYDGQPKFELDITGQGSKNTLVGAKDVKYLAKQWCVVNPSATNMTALETNADYACKNADCTSLGNGSSCSSLDNLGQASFAFNSYFQNFNQQNASCHFDGLAMLTTKDPSIGVCKFDVQLAPPPPLLAPAPAPMSDSADAPFGSPSGLPSGHGSKSGTIQSTAAPIATIASLLFGLFVFLCT